MRIPHLAPLLALALAALPLVAPGPAAAQSAADQSAADRMLATARQIRASAEQLKASLPPEDIARLIQQAEEIEQGVRDGAYAGAAAPPKAPSLSERILAERGGRLEWLAAEAACAGYTQENYRTFRYSSAINERDTHCRNAYGHWATYLRLTRDGGDPEAAEQALFYYDAAARRAVELHGRK